MVVMMVTMLVNLRGEQPACHLPERFRGVTGLASPQNAAAFALAFAWW